MAFSAFNCALIFTLCTSVIAFSAYPRPNWMQMERIKPPQETHEKRLVKSVLKDLLQRMSQSLDSPNTSPSPKKHLIYSTGLSREELKHLITVPEEVHQKWEQFKQTYCICLLFNLFYFCLFDIP